MIAAHPRARRALRIWAPVVSVAAAAVAGVVAAPLGGTAVAIALIAGVTAFQMTYHVVLQYARRRHRELLAVLYAQVDPEGFIRRAEEVDAASLRLRERVAFAAHLANGRAALGATDSALAALDEAERLDTSAATQLLVAANRASVHLSTGRAKAAKREMRHVEAVSRQRGVSSAQRERARRALAVQRLHLAVLEGEKVDADLLDRTAAATSSPLQRVRLAELARRLAERDGDLDRLDRTRALIERDGGSTVYRRRILADRAGSRVR